MMSFHYYTHLLLFTPILLRPLCFKTMGHFTRKGGNDCARSFPTMIMTDFRKLIRIIKSDQVLSIPILCPCCAPTCYSGLAEEPSGFFGMFSGGKCVGRYQNNPNTVNEKHNSC